jgi:glycosyltransferase involved in cell wall biosynthesis
MKIGLLAYSTNTGLGVQTLEFAEHMKPDRILLVDLSDLNGVETHHERFDDFNVVLSKGVPNRGTIDVFLDGLDVVFVCETPLNYLLFERARELGVKTILQPNHEFNDYYQNPNLPKPDLFALPSTWHYGDLPYENKMLLNVPVAREKLKKRRIKKFRNFLHVAGRPAIHDRNGTRETLFAFSKLPYEDITLTIRIQDKEMAEELRKGFKDDKRVIIDDKDVENYWDGYKGFDCLVIPRKYGGLCLPMQEALGCGIPVIMTDVSPNNEFLPMDWLVAADRVGDFMTRSKIDIYQANDGVLANRMAEFYLKTDKEVREENQIAHDLGEMLSWENQEPKYREVFKGVVDGSR